MPLVAPLTRQNTSTGASYEHQADYIQYIVAAAPSKSR